MSRSPGVLIAVALAAALGMAAAAVIREGQRASAKAQLAPLPSEPAP